MEIVTEMYWNLLAYEKCSRCWETEINYFVFFCFFLWLNATFSWKTACDWFTDPSVSAILDTGRIERVWSKPVYGKPFHSLFSPIVPNLVEVPPEFHRGWSRSSAKWMGLYGARLLNLSLSPDCRWEISELIVVFASSTWIIGWKLNERVLGIQSRIRMSEWIFRRDL